MRLYSEAQIKDAIPGEPHSHTFTRALAPQEPNAGKCVGIVSTEIGCTHAKPIGYTFSGDKTTEQPAEGISAAEAPLAEEFCRIMVHDKAHLNAPHELWTRHNVAQLDVNMERPIPLFQQGNPGKVSWEFVGWFQVVSWTNCIGGGREVRDFIQRRRVSGRTHTAEYWQSALADDWAKVMLEKVNDPALGNPVAAVTST